MDAQSSQIAAGLISMGALKLSVSMLIYCQYNMTFMIYSPEKCHYMFTHRPRLSSVRVGWFWPIAMATKVIHGPVAHEVT